MPLLVRIVIYKLKFTNIKINPLVEIEKNGNFLYGTNCVVSKYTNIVIPAQGSLFLSSKVYIGRYVEIGSDNISIGYDTSIQDRCVLLGNIKIGSGVIFGPNVFISSGRHHFDLKPYLPIREQDLIAIKTVQHNQIIIEDDCWIGINSVIMPGVVIGKGCIIGAGSIVTKNIPPYCVCAGSPAKVIRKRLEFSPPKELSALTDFSLPYFYSGFRYTYENNIWKVFVHENELSFALNFEHEEIAEISFINHGESEIYISCETKNFILPIGQSYINICISPEMCTYSILVLGVTSANFGSDQLEVLGIRTKAEERYK